MVLPASWAAAVIPQTVGVSNTSYFLDDGNKQKSPLSQDRKHQTGGAVKWYKGTKRAPLASCSSLCLPASDSLSAAFLPLAPHPGAGVDLGMEGEEG